MNDLLDPLLLARWQFGLTTDLPLPVRPLTIGMALDRRDLPDRVVPHRARLKYLQLTRFFGKLFLINFAMGVVTGIVQEFQFGMNWSAYSRFVGDVFGAPLAFEGLHGLLLRGDLHRPVDLRLGQAAQAACTSPPSGSPRSAHGSRRTSSSPPTRSCRTRSATR